MKLVSAKPFTFEGGKRAVLLLHGFTGNTIDVRELGRYLNERGYTCHGPLYEGHGDTPEMLVTTRAEQWWEYVVEGYRFLQKQGHEEIAVVGLSLGGVFALKTAYTFPVKALVSMCAPVKPKSAEDLGRHVSLFTQRYKKILGISAEQIEEEWTSLRGQSIQMVESVQAVIEEVGDQIQEITCPALVVQSGKDHPVNLESADLLYNRISSEQKSLIWYENSPHLVTRGPEKEKLHEDVYRFLEELDWEDA
ncbi:alpha/beta fold hydrolase [Fictibacillus sp. KIGAM418]|uniref:Alpha/beta fold hydrolase n=1 Tax=Fictibacillus marinisediminis TaxID=2878389 RepID=A0A9X1XBI1_9BACL|nr:alpha/beta fold hydrolase [Fictibacillus marinisediminis]MCK6256358.1 alpha/beta fold hydrolase [Fictibacillus marinisediminis]